MTTDVEEKISRVEIRLFVHRFSWKWKQFTDDRSVVAQILEKTRANLGYAAASRFPEVQFMNLSQTGEWYLDTAKFEEVHGMDSREANKRLTKAFVSACRVVGGIYNIEFAFDVYDMKRDGLQTESL